MAKADGQIILGLNISATTANIQAELNSILNNTKTKQIVLKTAIEKAQTEKNIESLVTNLSKKTVKLGVDINTKDVQGILAQQQKVASTQASLNRQMQEYHNIAKEIGVTLNKDTWNSFNHAIKTENFTKAKEIIKSAKKQIDDYNNSIKKMNSDTSVSGSVSSIVEKFRSLNTVSDETKQKVSQLKAALTSFENADSEQKKLRAYESLKQRLAELANEYKNISSIERTAIGNIPKTLEGIANKSVELKLAVDSSGINGSEITGLSSNLDELRVKAETLQQKLANLDPTNANDVKRLQEEVLKLDNEFKKVEKDAKIFEDVNSIATFTASIEKAKQKVEEYGVKYSAIKSRPDLVQELENLKNAANNISTPSQLKQFNAEFSKFDTKVIQAGLHCKSFGDILKSAFSNFAQFFSASRIIYEVMQSIKDMVSAVKELDAAMIELRKVTDASETEFQAFFERSKKTAIDYGTTMKDIINSTADFSRLGFNFEESEELAKTASVYNMVGDIHNIDQATESIISTMKAFGVEAKDSMTIVDKFNEVGNRFAISSAGIGEAFLRSASSMEAANNTIDQSIALITAANEIVQNPEKVGNAFKTISMRIRGAETELEEAGLDTEGMAKSTAKLREEILALADVDIMLDENTFKSTYQIMNELSQKWADLTDIQRASITELVAGKHQGNVMSSLMTNFDKAREALEVSMDSAGSGMKEFEIQMDSIEAKSNQFKAAFEALSTSVVNSDLLKGLIDAGTTLLQVLDSLIEKLGGFGNTITIIGLAIATLNFKGTVSLFTSIFNTLKNSFGIVPKLVTMFGNLKVAWELGQSAGGGFITTLKGASSALIGTSSAASIATASIMTIVAVIAIAVAAYQNYRRSVEEARKKTLEESNAVIDNANQLRNAYVTYMQYANRTSLTSSEEESFKSAIDQVTKSLGDKASALGDVTAGTQDYTEALKQVSEEELKAALTSAKQAKKAARDNLKDDTNSAWTGSKITIDLSGRTVIPEFKSAYEEVEKLMKDFMDEGTYGKELEPIGWDKNKQDYDAIVDYYYKLLELQNKLADAGNMDNDIYEDANRITSNLKDTVEDYLKKKYEELSLTYQLNNGIPTTIEEFKKYRDYLNSELGKDFIFDDGNSKLSSIIDSYLSEVQQYADLIFNPKDVKKSLPELEKQLADYRQALTDEYQKAEEWGLDSYLSDIKNETVQSVFGNVDMDKRTIITWSSILKDTYKNELKSWDYDPEIGGIDTVFGGSDRFGENLNGTGWEVAFTPILPDGTFLSKETVYDYIESILNEAYANDNQVTEEELVKLDTQGKQIGKVFVQGIFAGIDDSLDYENNGNLAETVGRLMHFSGIFGAPQILQKNIRQAQQSIDSMKGSVDKTVVSLKDLKEASSGIKSLASSYDEIFDKGHISLSTISEICEALELSGDELEKYKKILLSAKEGDKEYSAALSELTYKMLEKTFGTEGLANATEEEVAAVLRENDVTNASAVAHEAVTQAKFKHMLETVNLENATENEIQALINLATQSGATKTQIEFLSQALNVLSNSDLDLSSKCSELLKIAAAAGIATSAIGKSARILEGMQNGSIGALKEFEYSGKSEEELYNEIIQEFSNAFPAITDKTSPKYESQALKKRQEEAEKLRKEAIKKKKDYADKVSDINKDLAEKEAQFADDMAEAWEKEHLEQFKDNLKQYENVINQFKEKIDVTDSGLDWIEPDDFTTKADLLSLKLNQVTTYGAAMREEFDRLCSITPQTADEAEELASRIQTLGSDMRDNVSTLRETQVAIQKLRIEAISSILDSGVGQLEAELDRIDRRLKILNSDNSEDYRYVKKALDMDRQLPLMGDFKTQRDAKSKENRALISAEQEKQDKINAIVTRSLQMQAEANAAARAKERANLIKDMEDARADAAEKLKEATEDYIEFLKENKLYTDKTAKEIENIIKQTDLTFPEPDISSVTSAFDNIKNGIQEVADMVDGLEINIKGSASVSTGEGAGGGGGSIPSGGIPVGSAVYFQSKDPNGHVGIMGADGYIYHDELGKIFRNKLSEMSSKGYTYRGYGWNGGVALSAEEAAKVAAVAQDSTSYGVIPRDKKCQAWVADVYAAATGKPRVSKPSATEAWKAWGSSGIGFYPNSEMGFVSAKYEGGTVGAISNGFGDYGGKSYGIPQFSTATGSAANFIKWLKQSYPEIGNTFGSARAGTTDFDNRWLNAANKFPSEFAKAQNEYAFQTMVEPIRQKIYTQYGLDMNRSTALREALISAAYQYNNLTPGLLSGYKDGMSDREIIDLIYGNKKKNVNTNFKSSSATVRKSISNRIANEWKDVLNLLSYADGTSGHPGGLALVGDENFLKGNDKPSPELISYPDGSVEIAGQSGAEIRNLPKGSSVIPTKDTKKLIDRIPSYAGGIGRGNMNDEGVRNFLAALDSGWALIAGGELKDSDYLIKAGSYWNSPEYYADKAWSERTISDKYKGAYDRTRTRDLLVSAVETGFSEALAPYVKELNGYWDELTPQVNEIKQYIKENGLDKAKEKYGELYLTRTNTSNNLYDSQGRVALADSNYVTGDMLYKAHTSNYDYMMTGEAHQNIANAMLDYYHLKKVALYKNSDNFKDIMDLDKYYTKLLKDSMQVKEVMDEPTWYEKDFYGDDVSHRSHKEYTNPYSLFDKAIVSYFSELEQHKAENPDKILKIDEQLEFAKEHTDFLTSQQIKSLEDEKAKLEKEMTADINVISDSIKDLNPFEFILANDQLGSKHWNFDNNTGNPFDESYRYGSKFTYINGQRVETKEHSKGIFDALLQNKNYQQSLFNVFDENGNIKEDFAGQITKLNSGLVRNADGTYTYTSDALNGFSITWDKNGQFQKMQTLNDGGTELSMADFIQNYKDVVNAIADYKPKIITSGIDDLAVNEFNTNTAYGAELSDSEKAEALAAMGLGDTYSDGSKIINPADMLPLQQLTSQFEDAWDKIARKARVLTLDIDTDWRLSDEQKDLAQFRVAQDIFEEGSETLLKMKEQAIAAYLNYLKSDNYSKEVADAYQDVIDDIDDRLQSLADEQASKRQAFIQKMENDISAFEDFISEHNTYNDWAKIGTSELKELRKELDVIRNAHWNKALTDEAYQQRLSDYNQKVYSTGKSLIQNAFNELIQEYEDEINDKIERKNLDKSRWESLRTLGQSYYDVINSVREATHDINKELKASQTMYEYLNEESRELLFNEKDYKTLSSQLNTIKQEATALQSEYMRKIRKADKESIDQITASYQREYEVLMKNYEIAKADLEVAKKKQKLDNVLNERNVSMFINGEWRWVANSQDVIDAQNELEDAKFSQEQANEGLNQTLNLNHLQAASDGITTQINYLNSDLEVIRDKWSDIQKLMDGKSLALSQILQDIAESDCTQLQDIMKTCGSSFVDFFEKLTGKTLNIPENKVRNYDKNTDYMSLILYTARTKEDVEEYNHLRNQKIKNEGLNDTMLYDEQAIRLWREAEDDRKKRAGYAKGTKNARKGIAQIGEIEPETLITNKGKYIPIEQPTLANLLGGEVVFNSEQMNNLRTLYDLSKVFTPNLESVPISNVNQNQSTQIDNSVTINGLTVEKESNGELLNQLRRLRAIS